MSKQIIRQLQKSGNGFVLRVPTVVRENVQAEKQGDNLAWEHDPDSDRFYLKKVVLPSPDPGPGPGPVLDAEKGKAPQGRENEPKVSEVDENTPDLQYETLVIEFCVHCGTDAITVIGNKYFCPECEVGFEVIPTGDIRFMEKERLEVVDEKVETFSERLDRIEQAVENSEPKEPVEVDTLFGEPVLVGAEVEELKEGDPGYL